MNYAELSKEAAQAYDAHQFQKVVDYGEELSERFEDEMDDEDWYLFGHALRKMDRPAEALAVSRRLYRMNEDIPQVRMLYAWCIYDTAVKRDRAVIAKNEAQFFRAVEAISELTGDQPGQAFSPHVRAVFRMIDYLQEERREPAEDVLSWLNWLRPDELSDQVGHWQKDDDTIIELPSDREKWYSAYTKALFELGRYQECLDACEEALGRIPKFSGTNHVWIQRRHALCNGALGFRETAIEELQEVLSVEKRWFIYYEIARLYYGDDQIDRALAYSAHAALCGEIDAYRWKLFAFMAVIADKGGSQQFGHQHAALALSLRQAEGWSIGKQHRRLAEQFDVDLEQLPAHEQLINDLRPWWHDQSDLG